MCVNAAYGVFPHRVALNEVLETLNQGGFGKESICMMLPPTHPIATIVRDADVRDAERGANIATAGLIGWLSEFGAVLIPTVGFFIRSQAFFHALFVRNDTMARCGSSNSLEGLGFPEGEARRFERHLAEVGVLVYVSCRERARTRWALELLRGTGAQEAGTLENAEEALVQTEEDETVFLTRSDPRASQPRAQRNGPSADFARPGGSRTATAATSRCAKPICSRVRGQNCEGRR